MGQDIECFESCLYKKQARYNRRANSLRSTVKWLDNYMIVGHVTIDYIKTKEDIPFRHSYRKRVNYLFQREIFDLDIIS